MGKTTSHILKALLRHLKSRPTIESVSVDQYRALLEKSAAFFKPDKTMKTAPVRAGSIEAQWIQPANHDNGRIILYVHGGGFIAGSINSHGDLASRIASACDAKTLIFNYRLAPEHPFPEGLNDVITLYEWLIDHSFSGHSISLVGDSAGAGLILSLLSTLLSGHCRLPACSVLISPWIDLECKNSSHFDNTASDPMLSSDILKKTAALYTDKNLSHPLISPINNDFTGLTPILIQTGKNEILLDDSIILAQRLKSAGIRVELEIWEDMFHVWHYFAKYLSEGRQAIGRIGEFIRQYA